MIFAFLPLADVKMVRLPIPEAAEASTLAVEAGVALALLGLLGAAFLLQRLWRMVLLRPKPVPETWLLIDGSNVMHWVDNIPSLEPVQQVVDHLKGLGYVPGVVFDANAGWKLFGRYVDDRDFAKLLRIEREQVLVVPKGTQADPYLLRTARDFGVRIISNDRFRDWSADYPEVLEPGFLIPGSLVGGKLRLAGLDPAAQPMA
jgi:Zc3h12a-like Ribonuclease NYN domain